MDNIYIWAPIIFGASIGWQIVYFTRKLSDYTADSLRKVAGVSIGGVGFCSLAFIHSSEIGSKVIMYYILGIGVGFFLHWIYQISISFCLRKRGFNHRQLYDALTGCNISSEQNEDSFKLHRKSEKLIICYKQWDKGKISETEFIDYLKDSGISKKDFSLMIDENGETLLLDDETLTTIKAKKLDQYFVTD